MLSTLIQKVKNRYGSKYGLTNQWKYSVMARLGDFDRYALIQTQDIQRLVFICAGNICRSPLAEVVARHAGLNATSYGLHCRGGDKADPRAIAYAAKNFLNLEEHTTKNIKDYVPQAGDLLVGMEPSHAKELEDIFGTNIRISLIGMWLSNQKVYIHDPYSANEIFFTRCEDEVKKATLALAFKLGR